ncbi:MAG: hypothetical protein AAGF32_01400 [Pseudomonadota bacterium]
MRLSFAGKVGVLLCLVAPVIVAGCRQEERDRPLAYEEGTYKGKPDQPISDATRQQLRERVRRQSFN